MSKICIPIQAKTVPEALKKIKKGRLFADMFEIWLDQMAAFDIFQIKKVARRPIIVVNKGKKERGAFRGSEEERVDRLIEAKRQGADYIDIGIHTGKKRIKKLVKASGKAKIIVSAHDFSKTPEMPVLEKIGQKALSFGADIIKIAVFPKKTADLEILLKIAEKWRQAGYTYIIIGMGERGVVTRVFAHQMGSFLTYASLEDEEKTAPGQITARKLREFRTVIASPPAGGQGVRSLLATERRSNPDEYTSKRYLTRLLRRSRTHSSQ